jgi:hypothetical protein
VNSELAVGPAKIGHNPEMRGQIRYRASDAEKSASQYVARLRQELERARAKDLVLTDTTLRARGGLLRPVSNWNLLVCVSSMEVRTAAERGEVTVHYMVRMRELLATCGLASVLALGIAISEHSVIFMAAAGGMIWGWLFGVNYLISYVRLRSTFRRIVRDLSG